MKPYAAASLVAAVLIISAGISAGFAPPVDDPPLSVYDDLRARAADPSSNKIVDGSLISPGELVSVVGITQGRSPNPACTGTLVAGDIVLTAGHCICDVVIGTNGLPNANVLVGNGPADPARRYLPAIGYYAPISCASMSDANMAGKDWGLVQIRTLTSAGMSIARPAAIDSTLIFRVAGFGAVDLAGVTTDFRKRRANIPRVSTHCTGRRNKVPDSKVYRCVKNEIVAGQRRGPDSCRGDSGGPLMVVKNDVYRLAGITSRSIPNVPTRCGNGGIYERLTPDLVVNIDAAAKLLRKRAAA